MLRLPDLLNITQYKRKYKMKPRLYITLFILGLILLAILWTSQQERLILYFADKVVAK